METVDDVLQHYGVKGMRWGVRRSREQIDSDSADVSRKKSIEETVKRNAGSTNPLSNAELRALNERLNLEQNYRQLVAKENASKPTPPIKQGVQWAGKFVKDVGNQQAKNAANALIKAQIDAKIAQATKPKPTLADKIAPYSATQKKKK